MNPRLFFRERSYHKALLLTYSFDPIFFEQVVLPDLWAGRSSDILVLGDQGQIEVSTEAAAGQLWHLGKQYLLAGAKHLGAFHSKVFLRLGPKDGVVMLGSGNVTSSGWGGNQELGTAWMLGPEQADKGGWLHPFLDDVLSWCGGDLERDAVRRMKDVPWLSLTPVVPGALSPVLHSRQGRALGPALAQRWAGRQFDEVKILTGSTDESGAFLRWAHSTFGVKHATVALTPSTASFIPEQLADLPLQLRLVAAPVGRPLHAKLCWFEGPSGPAAVMGSANCSAAAWLLPPNQGGNVETVVVYDQPNDEEFEGVLGVFSAPTQHPADLLEPKTVSTTELATSASDYALKSLRWDSLARRLQANIGPMPAPDMTVELLLAGHRLPMMRPHGPGGYWECALQEGLGSATAFASVLITRGDDRWTTLSKWVNDITALEHASHAARLLEPFKGLERIANSGEQRQMLDELQEVAQALFNDTASFRDPGFGSGANDKAEDEEDAPSAPVNPNDLIVHLEDQQESLPHFSSPQPGNLSLTGILQLLFDAEADEGAGSAAAQDEQLDEEQLPDEGGAAGVEKETGQENATQEPVPVEDRFRERLAAQITTFLGQMSSTTFANRCTATQMVQAVSFPLAVALRGKRRGWVRPALAERWALEVFSILFCGNGPRTGGLLGVVEQRYKQNDQKSTFNDVVGDGTLWVVLVATLGNANWQGIGTDIDKAIAMREVFTSPQLLASALPGRIAGLLGNIRIDDARSYLVEVAPTITRLLFEIEEFLWPVWETEMREQSERSITHKVGDLLWRQNVGWAVCLAVTNPGSDSPIHVRLRGFEKEVARGFYINVTELADRDKPLRALIDQLRDLTCERDVLDA